MRRFKVYTLNFFGLIAAVLAFQWTHVTQIRAQAVVFQNGNTACGSEILPCDTINTQCQDITSISCKNFTAAADFNNDGFVDCAGVSAFYNASSFSPTMLSVLFNSENVAACDPSFDQFEPVTNYEVFNVSVSGIGSIVTGSLDGDAFSDLAFPRDSGTDPSDDVSSAFGSAGGFGASPLAVTSVDWINGPQQSSYSNNAAEHTFALLDCDGDSDLDGAITMDDISGRLDLVGFSVLRNDGSGLQAPSTFVSNDVPFSEGISVSIAVEDFDNDADTDVVLAIDRDIAPESLLITCLNDGNCGFTCLAPVDLTLPTTPPHTDPNVFSVAAGDFNGDGNADVAVSEPGLAATDRGIHYYFGTGDGNFAPLGTHVTYTNPADGSPRALTTGFFNNDDVVDLALVTQGPGTLGSGTVAVFTIDAAGSVVTTPLSFGTGLILEQNGLDAADFDNQGCDDIIALGNPLNGARGAYVFMNDLETMAAEAGADQTTELNTPLAIEGAACTLSPDDPGAQVNVTWTVSPATGATLSNSDQLAPTLTATLPGTYTLTLDCNSRCTGSVTDTKTVTVNGVVPPPLTGQTQGGCLASLNGADASGGNKMSWLLMCLIPVALFSIRRAGKRGVFMAAVFTLIMMSGTSHLRADSFSVNSFEPTVDDSDYFTVYDSPTMLKRNFHVGFFLDYAKNPYEFGNANFDRTSGVVDDLITGNIVGSYGVLDWLSVGVLIPVYFWEHIDSTNLLLDENNFDLGDIQLVLKVRLLDREKHHIGISVVPFVSFPSSTGSSDFLGNDSFAGGGKVVIDGRIKDRVSLALNVGYLTRTKVTDISGNVLNDQFLAGLGISIDIIKEKLKLIGEAQVATVTSHFFSDRRTTPAEARVGFRYTWAHNNDINAGAGFGLSNGIASPDFRIFAGYTYTKRPVQNIVVPPPAVDEIHVGDELTLQDKIYFEFDKAVIRDISKPTLDKIAGFLKIHPEVTKIRIDGYTCDLGTDAYNLRLSQKRSKAAADYLIGQDIDPSRIGTVDGFGEKNPLVPNSDEPHREQNRRVQIFVEAVGH